MGDDSERRYDHYYDPLQLPLVDFDRYMVLAMFGGRTQNVAGYEPVSLTETEDQLTLRFWRKSFQTAGPDGGARSVTPYAFFVVPATEHAVLLTGADRLMGSDGGLTPWKTVHRFAPR